jgi:hypothetical protein
MSNQQFIDLCDEVILTRELLDSCPNLVALSITCKKEDDFSILKDYEKIKFLYLYGTKNIDLSILTGLKHIQWLTTDAIDISFISECTELLVLSLIFDQFNGNLNPLCNCTKLKILFSTSIHIKNISFVSKCTQLIKLDIFNSPITDINSLSNCKNLIYLQLGSSDLNNLSALNECKKIECIYVNNIRDNSFLKIHNDMIIQLIDYEGEKIYKIISLKNKNSKDIDLKNKISENNNIPDLSEFSDLFIDKDPFHNDINIEYTIFESLSDKNYDSKLDNDIFTHMCS